MDIKIDAIQSTTDMPECISMSLIQQASTQDDHLQYLKNYIIAGWLSTKNKLDNSLKPYWSYRDELVVIDGVMLKGRCIATHMWICSLVYHKCRYWKIYQNCSTCLKYQQMQSKEKIIHHNIPLRPWEVLGADVFHFNNKKYLCIVDYHSKFPIIKN